MSEQNRSVQELDGRADFDFFIGVWNGHNRRLKEWLKGSNDWEEFEGTTVDCKVLGGLGNVDEVTFDSASGRGQGLTVRLFDPQTKLWSLYWADSKHGTLQVPMIGRFKDGRGEFYDREVFEGQSILSRFIWSNITETTCRWEQAFSTDGGATWETNWVADFTRREQSQLDMS